MYGFEGAANIPAGSAIETFVIFKEGKGSGLQRVPGGLPNERKLGFKLHAESFDVKFYDDFPGRPKEFVSKLNVLDGKQIVASKTIRVNDPMEYQNFVFYQASYGRMGDFDLKLRVIGRKDPANNQVFLKSHLGEAHKVDKLGVTLAPTFAHPNLQGLGPAVQIQEVGADGKPKGEAFWVLKKYPEFDIRRGAPYVVVADEIKELFFTGLQIGYDPGAPIYWLGCFGMLLGTFYALFTQHKKYYIRYENGTFDFAGTIHRLPAGFDQKVATWASRLMSVTKGGSATS
jgi:cytochrome c biogenesis protein